MGLPVCQRGGQTIGKTAARGAQSASPIPGHRPGSIATIDDSAAGSTMPASVHASKCEPGEAEEGKGDRDADFVQRSSRLALRYRCPVV
jgi:hypothetical protein